MAIIFERLPTVLAKRGRGRASHYNDINAGLFPPPVNIGLSAVAWPAHETEAVNAARLAGKSDDEIRKLVADLVASRKQAA
jgi:prophage regulatory protein